MSFDQVLDIVLLAVVLSPLVVAVAYFSARAGAFAWFSTKRDHIKKVLNELNNGE